MLKEFPVHESNQKPILQNESSIARSNLAILPHTASEHVSAALKISMVYLMTLSVTLTI
jgi:hypothetical protein